MKWTTEPIAEPGWYWFKDDMGAYQERVYNYHLDGSGLCVGQQAVRNYCADVEAWCRIPEPEGD